MQTASLAASENPRHMSAACQTGGTNATCAAHAGTCAGAGGPVGMGPRGRLLCARRVRLLGLDYSKYFTGVFHRCTMHASHICAHGHALSTQRGVMNFGNALLCTAVFVHADMSVCMSRVGLESATPSCQPLPSSSVSPSGLEDASMLDGTWLWTHPASLEPQHRCSQDAV